MKTRLWSLAVLTLATRPLSTAQQRHDPIARDGWADTAMGSAALGHHAINCGSGTNPGLGPGGGGNTAMRCGAAGNTALGDANTAWGAEAGCAG